MRKAGPVPRPGGGSERPCQAPVGTRCRPWAAGLHGPWGCCFWEQNFLFQNCRLSAAAGWERVQKGVCLGLPKAVASDPPLLLGTSLEHLGRKRHGHREQRSCVGSTVSFLSSGEALPGLCGPGCLRVGLLAMGGEHPAGTLPSAAPGVKAAPAA